MKKNILFFAALLFCVGLQAQADSISWAPFDMVLTANLDDPSTSPGDVVAHAFVKNNSNSTKTFVWERIVNDLPAGTVWASAICDVNNCYLPFVATKEFILEAGQEGTMDIHMYPGGTPGSLSGALPGEGEVQVRIWEKDDESNEEVGSYKFIITDNSTSTNDVEIKQLRVFPNPVIDYIQISENTIVDEVAIFNLIGERVLYFPTSSGQRYNVADLKKGMYLIQMLDKDSGVLKTIKMIKA